MLPLFLCVGVTMVESPRELHTALEEGAAEIAIAPGVFTGNWTVHRPVRITGSEGTVLEGTGVGSVLVLNGDDIVVERLAVRHSGRRNTSEDAGIKASGARIEISDVVVTDTLFGITLEQCKACVIDRATVIGSPDDPVQGDGIKLWESHGSAVTRSYVEASRDVVVWYSRHVRLFGNEVRRSRYGTHFMYVHDIDVSHGTLVDNVVGVFVMYSSGVHISDSVLAGARGAAGMGLGVKESEDITLDRASIVANTTGLYFDRAPRVETEPVRVSASLIGLNGVGVRLHSSQKGIELAENDFRHNTSAIEVEGGGDALGLSVHDNHWSDYEGFDLDRDGKGDVAFEVKALSRAWTDEQPALAFFKESVAMHALDVVSQSLPLFASKLLVRDAAPKMEVRR
ncbi:MAG: nitrous oxide reductase family maturation protein NosD [Deltaproteobacteria bacterium]|nr:nitrous oxide reductase family maturation protein NosD [Deltaproteobacteria bacterium]